MLAAAPGAAQTEHPEAIKENPTCMVEGSSGYRSIALLHAQVMSVLVSPHILMKRRSTPTMILNVRYTPSVYGCAGSYTFG
jgi:hypothetical protein